jgi:hypothetical protein
MKIEADAPSRILDAKTEVDVLERKLAEMRKQYESYEKPTPRNEFYRYEYQKEILHEGYPIGTGYGFFENEEQAGDDRRLGLRKYERCKFISEYDAKILDAYEARVRSLDAQITEKKRQLMSMPLQPSDAPKPPTSDSCITETQNQSQTQ